VDAAHALAGEAAMSAPILEVRNVSRAFDMLRAVDNVSLAVGEGEVVGIIGTNGSGKTTLLNLITGYLAPTSGRISFQGADITGLGPRRITDLGVARSFQIPQLYIGLTVLDNVLIAIAAHSGRGADFWSPMYSREHVAKAREILGQFGLDEQAEMVVANLPEGGRKVLDVALSVVLEPKVLLMDEPTSGVSARDKFSVIETLMPALAQRGVTTIFVEHDMEIVERYAARAVAFDGGKILADGPVGVVLARPDVRRAVLGEE
jgi:branched-chain amino acid transport system ATP-binding protein